MPEAHFRQNFLQKHPKKTNKKQKIGRREAIVLKPTQLLIKRIYGVQWKKPRINQDELAKLYWDQGLSQVEIARRYKIRRATISAAIKAFKPVG